MLHAIQILLGHITALAICGLLLQMEQHGLPVTTMSCAKATEPTLMPFGALTWVGPRNQIPMQRKI